LVPPLGPPIEPPPVPPVDPVEGEPIEPLAGALEGEPIVPLDSLPLGALMLLGAMFEELLSALLAMQINLRWCLDSQVPLTLSPFELYEHGSPADLSLQACTRCALLERACAGDANAPKARHIVNDVRTTMMRFTRFLLDA
jgi:hypothetical protein